MNDLLENMVEPSVVKKPLVQDIMSLRHRCISLGRLSIVLLKDTKTTFPLWSPLPNAAPMDIELTTVLMVALESVNCLLRGTLSPLKACTSLGLTLLNAPPLESPPIRGVVQQETVRQLTLGRRRHF